MMSLVKALPAPNVYTRPYANVSSRIVCHAHDCSRSKVNCHARLSAVSHVSDVSKWVAQWFPATARKSGKRTWRNRYVSRRLEGNRRASVARSLRYMRPDGEDGELLLLAHAGQSDWSEALASSAAPAGDNQKIRFARVSPHVSGLILASIHFKRRLVLFFHSSDL